jgi:ABC-type transport system involved in multi-copper enzyme maturation permease subunit
LAEWRAGLAAQLPGFAFPASLLKVSGNFLPVILLAVYFATALVAGEFEWGTVRTVHLTSSRVAAMAVRILFVVLLVAIVVGIALLLVALLPFLLSFDGRPLQEFAAPVPDLATTLGSQLATVLPFIAIPVLLSVLARSSSIAFLLTLLLFVADLAVAGAPIWVGSVVPWVPALTISGSVGRVLGGESTQFASLVPVGVSLAAVLAWAVLPVVAAIAWFRRADINE